MMQPYRLINSFEMTEVNQHVTRVIQQWNNQFALTPLAISLAVAPKEYLISNALNIHINNSSLAMIPEHYLTLFNQVLFGEDNFCFNSASQELILILLHNLFKIELCQINKTTDTKAHWFYKGSPCLLLTLSTHENNITLVINPDWVYQTLSPNKRLKDNLDSLDEALAEHVLTAHLELTPLSLPIKQLLNIQIGDVITTDHPIATPLRLTQNQQLLAQADLGQSSHHKSYLKGCL